MTMYQPFINVATRAARQAGAVLQQWRGRFSVTEKGRFDLVTEADMAAQQAVQSVLNDAFPDHRFMGEEGDTPILEPDGSPIWIVDPLDGTTNYVHDCPVYCTSIGLEIEGELVVGVIYDPTRDELFHAARGQGAFLNDNKIECSTTDSLDQALISTGFPPDMAGHEKSLRIWEHLSFKAQSLRRTGSTALNLAYVAAGRHDAFWTVQAHPWDAAAGFVLVREAGGNVSNLDGSPYQLRTLDLMASNGAIHGEMLAQVNRI